MLIAGYIIQQMFVVLVYSVHRNLFVCSVAYPLVYISLVIY